MNWISVVDTAVKIGLGALISAIATLLTLRQTQSFEKEKEARKRHELIQTEKRKIYVEFAAASQALVQGHTLISCNLNTDEYKKYLFVLNEVQIISPDIIRIAAYDLSYAVGNFVLINKNQQEVELLKNMRRTVDASLGLFQKLAQVDVQAEYDSVPDFSKTTKVPIDHG